MMRRMHRNWLATALLCCSGSNFNPLDAQDAIRAETASKSFWRAGTTVAAINTLVWGFDRYVKDAQTARVGVRSWARNLVSGFEWDDNVFATNQFAHPYHGSLYFSAARVNGYGFWGAAPFAAAGSLSWELFAETNAPSFNDFVNTTLGGIALGEVTHRISHALLAGGPGLRRTVGALAVSPGSGLGRAVRERDELLSRSFPASIRQEMTSGYGWLTDDGSRVSRPVLTMRIESGTPFDSGPGRPYEAFDVSLHLTGGERSIVSRLELNGVLGRRSVLRSERGHLVITGVQHYDYFNTSAFEWSAQSVSGGLAYRRDLSRQLEFRVGTRLVGTVLGAISSEHAGVVGRTYDYGPGLGLATAGSLQYEGRELLKIERKSTWLHSVNGADAVHVARLTTVGLRIPARRLLNLGGEATVFSRTSRYAGLPRVDQSVPQIRAYIVLGPR